MHNQSTLYIFDTTLRDGEQVPGASLKTEEKVVIAQQLEKLGVDVIEAGFPISSPGDFEAVEKISLAVQDVIVCGLARAVQKDIDVAFDAIKKAKRPRIHTGIGVSDSHIQYKFRSTREDILYRAVEAVKYAKKYVEDVEFYGEDAGRADLAFLAQVVEAVIKAGATVVNIPDTTGYCFPEEYAQKIKYLIEHVPSIDQVIISAHCHNDLGLATANALAGIQAGVRQVECTINGIGERAGNTALEEVVMALKTRKVSDLEMGIDTKQLYPTSKMVSDLMGMPVQANKAIVGRNAFSHSSGIHQDGVLKHRETYEIIDPAVVGVDMSSIVLTARSGRAALKHRLELLGYKVDDADIEAIYTKFLHIADQKKEVRDDDLRLLMGENATSFSQTQEGRFQLEQVQIICGNKNVPTATLIITDTVTGEELIEASTGAGPVDAGFSAINKIVSHDKHIVLKEYLVQAVTEGIDATGKVSVKVVCDNKQFYGFGMDEDIIVASIHAYLSAINKVVAQ